MSLSHPHWNALLSISVKLASINIQDFFVQGSKRKKEKIVKPKEAL